MKKYIFNIIKVLIFILGFSVAFYYFLPWREIGKFSMSIAHSQLEKSGVRTSWSDIVGEDNGFTVNNFSVNGMVNISFESLTIRPRFLSSLLSLAGVFDIRFRGVGIMVGQNFNLGDGSVLLSASPGEIFLENLRTRGGEISISGELVLNTSEMKISRANAALAVPNSLENSLDLLKNFLPLINEGGRWYLRR